MKKNGKVIFILCFILALIATQGMGAHNATKVEQTPSDGFSVGGFYPLSESGRTVYSMNPGWRFYKGALDGAWKVNFDDGSWQSVNLPNGLELLPAEASGSVNYQGPAWYRKHFRLAAALKGKKIFLHFEGIMGKSKVWINGHAVIEHFGGYLPVIIDATAYLHAGKENVIAVLTDNSDDGLCPPGKSQNALDFTYCGGIYRDCWMVVCSKVYITDPNEAAEKAGGGLFVHDEQVSSAKALVVADLEVKNDDVSDFKGFVDFALKDRSGALVVQCRKKIMLPKGQALTSRARLWVKRPALWSPDSPYLYRLEIRVKNSKGHGMDGSMQRVGIRSIVFKGKEGFWLNGKPFDGKLIGANRHQDYAIIGNALPNSLHWRDAKKLRDAGIRVIRGSHYPQDPAFMDACDELGLFVIPCTPGWQYWNNDPVFAQRIYSDIRNMVRRDRNRPSILFWEPILNETRFPAYFAHQAQQCVKEEYPFEGGNYTAIDPGSQGSQSYPVIYSHPVKAGAAQSIYSVSKPDETKVYFTREFGDNVDDWSAHNSDSRVLPVWGEQPMLIQAQHYADCLEDQYAAPVWHMGGALWCGFDNQRGYHSQAFYGGIMDVYRQPKLSYYMFQAQRPAVKNADLPAESGPMVYIAHDLTPFSSRDITVYSNCEEVRLTVFEGGKHYVYKRTQSGLHLPSPVITFKNAYDFMRLKALSRAGKQKQVYILAEGLMGGKVVATAKKMPSRKPVAIRLRLDNAGRALQADGSDIVTVVAEIVDAQGVVKHLSNYMLRFSVEGQGVLLANEGLGNNPEYAAWGVAPVLIRSTMKAGTIKVRAELLKTGVNSLTAGEISFESVKPKMEALYEEKELGTKRAIPVSPNVQRESTDSVVSVLTKRVSVLKKQINDMQLHEVEKQQDYFGEHSR